ncbi:unnamed protein product [Cylicocyclus nassatus]|uniref:Uncharacterized protein n=1 Tax=Cylicocyclus nassatus TaxID=53992 RepID=A0AA36MA49_CYLNA|nr:unnamed protein product [Cylicocyclus nassatus]
MSNITTEEIETPLIFYTIKWINPVLDYIRKNWIALFIAIVITTLVLALLDKIISPYLHEIYKRLLFYDSALGHLKDVLEMDYDVLWNQPDFCLAYLKFHEAYQTFLATARSNHAGKISKVSRYNKYAVIRMH